MFSNLFSKIKTYLSNTAALLKSEFHRAGSLIGYLKLRMKDKSTWAAFGAVVPTVAAVQHPWNFLMLLIEGLVVLWPQ